MDRTSGAQATTGPTVAGVVRTAILEGEFAPGQRLIEALIALPAAALR